MAHQRLLYALCVEPPAERLLATHGALVRQQPPGQHAQHPQRAPAPLGAPVGVQGTAAAGLAPAAPAPDHRGAVSAMTAMDCGPAAETVAVSVVPNDAETDTRPALLGKGQNSTEDHGESHMEKVDQVRG
eukprot:s63_g47.t1